MDVRAGYMENAMSNTTAMGTPQEQVGTSFSLFLCVLFFCNSSMFSSNNVNVECVKFTLLMWCHLNPFRWMSLSKWLLTRLD